MQLHFRSKLCHTLFTGNQVRGEQRDAIVVVLLDKNTGKVVTSGPESSAKLDVVVLNGDFNNEDDDNWTEEEFIGHMVKPREGKGPLLSGDLKVTLNEGVGTLGDVRFSDNSSWVASKKFRLGLKPAIGYCKNFRVREAKASAIRVMDNRGERKFQIFNYFIFFNTLNLHFLSFSVQYTRNTIHQHGMMRFGD